MLRCDWDWTRFTSLKWVEGEIPENTHELQTRTAFEIMGLAVVPITHRTTVMPKKMPVENQPFACVGQKPKESQPCDRISGRWAKRRNR
jgi:hypothetical protein